MYLCDLKKLKLTQYFKFTIYLTIYLHVFQSVLTQRLKTAKKLFIKSNYQNEEKKIFNVEELFHTLVERDGFEFICADTYRKR